jgi:hypothetical protein
MAHGPHRGLPATPQSALMVLEQFGARFQMKPLLRG